MFGLEYHGQLSVQLKVLYHVGQSGNIQVRAPVYAAAVSHTEVATYKFH